MALAEFPAANPETDGFSGAAGAQTESQSGQSDAQPSRNALEIQFFGLQRSGNHAVLSWIFRQYDEPVYFFNNVKHFTDPILNFRYADIPNTVVVRRGPSGGDAQQLKVRQRTLKRLEAIRTTRKCLLAYSYENFPLAQLQHRELVSEREQRIGHSESVRRVLLLRDFYNWIASRIRLIENKGNSVPGKPEIKLLISRWLAYAQEFVGETSHMESEAVIRISFNRWVEEVPYRIALLDQIAVPLKDNSIDHVPDVGGGSSFDGNVSASQARSMRVTERWRYLLEDKCADSVRLIRKRATKIDAYNREIFGFDCPL